MEMFIYLMRLWLSHSSRVQLSFSTDSSLPGSSFHGIFQARVPEWGAIAFSVIYLNITSDAFMYTFNYIKLGFVKSWFREKEMGVERVKGERKRKRQREEKPADGQ